MRALVLLQEAELRKGLHAFCDHFHLEHPRHRQDGRRDRAIAGVVSQIPNEGAIHLEPIDRHAVQALKIGVAGAEVVDRDGYADRVQLIHQSRRPGLFQHDHRFGDLELEQRGGEPDLGEDPRDLGGEVVHGELPSRDIDRDARNREALFMPLPRLLAGGPQHPLPDRNDQPGGLGDRNELGRRYDPELGMGPAQQGFHPGHLARGQADLRLIVQRQLAALERTAQFALDRVALQRAFVHRDIEKGIAARRAALAEVHREIGVTQQRAGIRAVGWRNRDADARRDHDGVLGEQHRLLQRGDQPFGHPRRILAAADLGQHHHEFVAAQASEIPGAVD